jgi:4-hydroxybenzoate polyprenyltransferase
MLMVCASYLLYLNGSPFFWLHLVGAGLFIGLLFYQHTLVKENDLTKVNMAFFTTNGIASVLYGICFLLDFLL